MKRVVLILSCLLVLVVSMAGCSGGGESELNYDQAVEKLNAFTKSGVVGKEVSHQPDANWISSDSSINELPPIDKYPLSVSGGGQLNIEVFSSTEKSDISGNSWLDIQARAFNEQGYQINGKTVSVSIRPIASGLALDYISKRSYVPDAFSPANELWGEMVKSAGVSVNMIDSRLTGNTAGILMKKDAYDNFIQKYNEVSMPTVVNAVMGGDIVLGHTNPSISSTGLNIFTQELRTFDPANPLSADSVEKFRQFANLVPPASPTTKEMAKVAAKNIMDSMIMESQAYSAEPGLSDWVFTPCGVRHDSPLYTLSNVSDEKNQLANMFASFCKSPEAQASASSFGFNQHDDYFGAVNEYSGTELSAALELWKQNKDGGKPVISVFIVDRSGSMAGSKLERVNAALINSMQYINQDNYIGLVSYSSANDVTVDLPIAKFTPKQQSLFAGAVNDFVADGGTATNSAIVVAMNQALKAKEAIPDAKIRILVLSDGDQNEGLSLYDINGVINGVGVPVYGIGFEANLGDLQKLAEVNEGYCINADSEDVIYKLKNLFFAEL